MHTVHDGTAVGFISKAATYLGHRNRRIRQGLFFFLRLPRSPDLCGRRSGMSLRRRTYAFGGFHERVFHGSSSIRTAALSFIGNTAFCRSRRRRPFFFAPPRLSTGLPSGRICNSRVSRTPGALSHFFLQLLLLVFQRSLPPIFFRFLPHSLPFGSLVSFSFARIVAGRGGSESLSSTVIAAAADRIYPLASSMTGDVVNEGNYIAVII
mmetsp:Transcript_1248/g.2525  ORF Transcript_1248/g.2525 Transcript_1248/m.2525 type:complete len:209 (-) Transcript_1248:284-910(-)